MAFDDLDLTAHDKEQKVFSDHSVAIGEGSAKDFKQIALKNHQGMIHGVDQKEADEKFDDFASMVEAMEQQFAKQRAEFMHRLNGYEVSAGDVRKAATNILRDYDKFAARFGLEGDKKDAVYEQILLLQTGTPEQQEQALKELQERDPELANAVLDEAKRERDLASDISLSNEHDFTAEYNSAATSPSAEAPEAFRKFGLN